MGSHKRNIFRSQDLWRFSYLRGIRWLWQVSSHNNMSSRILVCFHSIKPFRNHEIFGSKNSKTCQAFLQINVSDVGSLWRFSYQIFVSALDEKETHKSLATNISLKRGSLYEWKHNGRYLRLVSIISDSTIKHFVVQCNYSMEKSLVQFLYHYMEKYK